MSHLCYCDAFERSKESRKGQKPGWRGGIADRKVFARNPEIALQSFRRSGKLPEDLESVKMVWKVSE